MCSAILSVLRTCCSGWWKGVPQERSRANPGQDQLLLPRFAENECRQTSLLRAANCRLDAKRIYVTSPLVIFRA